MNDYQAYVPMSMWNKDHWSVLAYIETVMVECGGFQVGLDGRMRTNEDHYDILYDFCRRPKRPTYVSSNSAIIMKIEHGTRINGGTIIEDHDDWMCLMDIAAEGLLDLSPSDIVPGVFVHLSAFGEEAVAALRQHKARGGSFGSFDCHKELELAA